MQIDGMSLSTERHHLQIMQKIPEHRPIGRQMTYPKVGCWFSEIGFELLEFRFDPLFHYCTGIFGG